MDRQALEAADAARDITVCGRSLGAWGPTRLAGQGAHDPTPSPYAVLEDLVGTLPFDASSHLLDVGCGTGRVLAYHRVARIPGEATGVELDEALARIASSWTATCPELHVVAGDVLALPLAPFTHIYLFNPFDTDVLVRFLDKLEREARHAVLLVHMSDNGERLAYLGRAGWEVVREGSVQDLPAPDGSRVRAFGCPQTFTVWRFTPASLRLEPSGR